MLNLSNETTERLNYLAFNGKENECFEDRKLKVISAYEAIEFIKNHPYFY